MRKPAPHRKNTAQAAQQQQTNKQAGSKRTSAAVADAPAAAPSSSGSSVLPPLSAAAAAATRTAAADSAAAVQQPARQHAEQEAKFVDMQRISVVGASEDAGPAAAEAGLSSPVTPASEGSHSASLPVAPSSTSACSLNSTPMSSPVDSCRSVGGPSDSSSSSSTPGPASLAASPAPLTAPRLPSPPLRRQQSGGSASSGDSAIRSDKSQGSSSHSGGSQELSSHLSSPLFQGPADPLFQQSQGQGAVPPQTPSPQTVSSNSSFVVTGLPAASFASFSSPTLLSARAFSLLSRIPRISYLLPSPRFRHHCLDYFYLKGLLDRCMQEATERGCDKLREGALAVHILQCGRSKRNSPRRLEESEPPPDPLYPSLPPLLETAACVSFRSSFFHSLSMIQSFFFEVRAELRQRLRLIEQHVNLHLLSQSKEQKQARRMAKEAQQQQRMAVTLAKQEGNIIMQDNVNRLRGGCLAPSPSSTSSSSSSAGLPSSVDSRAATTSSYKPLSAVDHPLWSDFLSVCTSVQQCAQFVILNYLFMWHLLSLDVDGNPLPPTDTYKQQLMDLDDPLNLADLLVELIEDGQLVTQLCILAVAQADRLSARQRPHQLFGKGGHPTSPMGTTVTSPHTTDSAASSVPNSESTQTRSIDSRAYAQHSDAMEESMSHNSNSSDSPPSPVPAQPTFCSICEAHAICCVLLQACGHRFCLACLLSHPSFGIACPSCDDRRTVLGDTYLSFDAMLFETAVSEWEEVVPDSNQGSESQKRKLKLKQKQSYNDGALDARATVPFLFSATARTPSPLSNRSDPFLSQSDSDASSTYSVESLLTKLRTQASSAQSLLHSQRRLKSKSSSPSQTAEEPMLRRRTNSAEFDMLGGDSPSPFDRRSPTQRSMSDKKKHSPSMQQRLLQQGHLSMDASAEGSESVGGASCHQCKISKSPSQMLFCTHRPNPAHMPSRGQRKGASRVGTRPCAKKYCFQCLQRIYGEEANEADRETWRCPSCRGECTCANCCRKLGKKTAAAEAKAAAAARPSPAAHKKKGVGAGGRGGGATSRSTGGSESPVPSSSSSSASIESVRAGLVAASSGMSPSAVTSLASSASSQPSTCSSPVDSRQMPPGTQQQSSSYSYDAMRSHKHALQPHQKEGEQQASLPYYRQNARAQPYGGQQANRNNYMQHAPAQSSPDRHPPSSSPAAMATAPLGSSSNLEASTHHYFISSLQSSAQENEAMRPSASSGPVPLPPDLRSSASVGSAVPTFGGDMMDEQMGVGLGAGAPFSVMHSPPTEGGAGGAVANSIVSGNGEMNWAAMQHLLHGSTDDSYAAGGSEQTSFPQTDLRLNPNYDGRPFSHLSRHQHSPSFSMSWTDDAGRKGGVSSASSGIGIGAGSGSDGSHRMDRRSASASGSASGSINSGSGSGSGSGSEGESSERGGSSQQRSSRDTSSNIMDSSSSSSSGGGNGSGSGSSGHSSSLGTSSSASNTSMSASSRRSLSGSGSGSGSGNGSSQESDGSEKTSPEHGSLPGQAPSSSPPLHPASAPRPPRPTKAKIRSQYASGAPALLSPARLTTEATPRPSTSLFHSQSPPLTAFYPSFAASAVARGEDSQQTSTSAADVDMHMTPGSAPAATRSLAASHAPPPPLALNNTPVPQLPALAGSPLHAPSASSSVSASPPLASSSSPLLSASPHLSAFGPPLPLPTHAQVQDSHAHAQRRAVDADAQANQPNTPPPNQH